MRAILAGLSMVSALLGIALVAAGGLVGVMPNVFNVFSREVAVGVAVVGVFLVLLSFLTNRRD